MFKFVTSIYERLGLNAYVQGDPRKALAWFRRLEAAEPDSIRTLRNLGVILLASGDAEGAESYLLREERRFGTSFQRHSALADVAFARGRREEAVRRYAAALAEPEVGSGGSSRGTRSFLEKRLALCRDPVAFESAMHGAERFSEAEKARDAGDAERAMALFDEAVRLDPTHWPALNNAGSLALGALASPERALAYFERAYALAQTAQIARNVELARQWLATKSLDEQRAIRDAERKAR